MRDRGGTGTVRDVEVLVEVLVPFAVVGAAIVLVRFLASGRDRPPSRPLFGVAPRLGSLFDPGAGTRPGTARMAVLTETGVRLIAVEREDDSIVLDLFPTAASLQFQDATGTPVAPAFPWPAEPSSYRFRTGPEAGEQLVTELAAVCESGQPVTIVTVFALRQGAAVVDAVTLQGGALSLRLH